MGQYYIIANIDKEEYIKPSEFGDGFKLMEFGCTGIGTTTALVVLLSSGNGRGGGDLHTEDPYIGHWAGDRIVIAGDYADNDFIGELDTTDEELQRIANEVFNEGFKEKDRVNLYYYAQEEFEDISSKIRGVLCEDEYVHKALKDKPLIEL